MRMPRVPLILAGFLLSMTACDGPGGGEVASVEAVGAVGAQLLFDANGNGSVDGADIILSDWTVNLVQPAGGLVESAVTGEDGVARFEEVPVGRLVVSVPDDELGDTLSLVSATAQPFTLGAFQIVEIRPLLTLPFFSLPQVRTLGPAQPLFTEGVALNRFATGDRSLHIRAGNAYLRILSVDEAQSFSIGDSIRISGRTGLDQGVPVLDGNTLFRLGSASGVPEPVRLSTGEAAGARGGSLDAALVQINSADILEVMDEGPDGVVFRVDDGSGALRIRFRSFFNLEPDLFDPDTDSVGFAVGLLVPVRVGGAVMWEVRPRSTSDVVLLRPTST